MIPVRTITDQFLALGTSVEGGWRADPEAARRLWRDVRTRIADFEQQFSRFRPDSELSRVNAAAGQPVPVSAGMLNVIEAARRAWVQSEGLVDVMIGAKVIAAGYDVSFEKTGHAPVRTAPAAPSATIMDVQVNAAKQHVTLPPDTAMDIGGIGKGLLLDQLRPMIEAVTKDYWLSLGGDLLVSGVDDRGQAWAVGVEDPRAFDRDLGNIVPPPGRWAIATSGVVKRSGERAGKSWHHLIDPRTGAPSTTDVLAAAVLMPSGLAAEVAAKIVLFRGAQDGIGWANAQAVSALAVSNNGIMHHSVAMRRYFHAA